jgi:hypothetical protein
MKISELGNELSEMYESASDGDTSGNDTFICYSLLQ